MNGGKLALETIRHIESLPSTSAEDWRFPFWTEDYRYNSAGSHIEITESSECPPTKQGSQALLHSTVNMLAATFMWPRQEASFQRSFLSREVGQMQLVVEDSSTSVKPLLYKQCL